jgi:nicotinate phosphoribosyltransferase
MPRRRKRLEPASFDLPVEDLRRGAFSHATAMWARDVLVADGRLPHVTVQFSTEQAGLLGGIDEAIAVLKAGVEDWAQLTVQALYDGDRIEADETVMTVDARFDLFAHLAPLCVGVLSRRTRVTTNGRLLAEAARPKPVMMLPARNDHWLLHRGDALAAQIGGTLQLTGTAQSSSRTQPPLMLVPHMLIAAYGGDAVAAVRASVAHTPDRTLLVVPVDYDNDSVATSLAVARSQEGRVWGVQLGTSEHLVDRSIIPAMGGFVPTGVNPTLVWNVRNALDAEGLGDVKILVSGSITVQRIREFEDAGVPVDAYGVGSALTSGRFGFAADVVMLDGAPHARAGRSLKPNPRMERVR